MMKWSSIRSVLASLTFVLAFVYVSAVGLTASPVLDMQAHAQTQGKVPGGSLGNSSDAQLWRLLRQGQAVKISDSKTGSRVIIQSQGESWRALRNGPITTYGGWLLIVAAAVVLAFFLIRGRVRLAHGASGRTVTRFTITDRMVHWFVAILFVLLGLTGLAIMFGKFVLIPVFGQAGFSALASASLQIHNLFGPLFIIGILAMLFVYVKDNIANATDLAWIFRGGILFREGVPSGKYNFGEKTWFWMAVIGGILISGSGLLLDIPTLAESREQLQLANVIHGVAAVILIAASIGHIYLGTLGVEGAFDGMVTGEVDENWAREHHSEWAEEAIAEKNDQAGSATGTAPAE